MFFNKLPKLTDFGKVLGNTNEKTQTLMLQTQINQLTTDLQKSRDRQKELRGIAQEAERELENITEETRQIKTAWNKYKRALDLVFQSSGPTVGGWFVPKSVMDAAQELVRGVEMDYKETDGV